MPQTTTIFAALSEALFELNIGNHLYPNEYQRDCDPEIVVDHDTYLISITADQVYVAYHDDKTPSDWYDRLELDDLDELDELDDETLLRILSFIATYLEIDLADPRSRP